jgi:hypothetical protein
MKTKSDSSASLLRRFLVPILTTISLVVDSTLFAQTYREHYAPGVTPPEGLGRSVAINGKYILAGRPGYDGSRGDVIVFDTLSGRRLRSLTPASADSQSGDEFGFAVALRGEEAIISAPGDTTDVPSGTGSLYFFDLRTGKLRHKYTGSGGLFRLGHALAVEGSRIVVGAPNSPNGGTDRGIAFLLTNPPGTSSFDFAQFVSALVENGAKFGQSVAINGSFAAIGSPFSDNPGSVDSGRVFNYSLTSPTTFTISAPTPAAGAQFGSNVGLTGDSLVVSQGSSVFLMDNAGILKSSAGLISPIRSLAVSGRLIAVGTPGIGSIVGNQGEVSLFEANSSFGNLPFLQQVTPQLGLIGNEFCGTSVALHGDILATGVPGRSIDHPSGGGALGSILTAAPIRLPLQRSVLFPGVREVVTSGDSTPNRDRSTVSTPLEIAIGSNLGDESLNMTLSLTGPDTTGGRNQLWAVEDRALIALRQSLDSNVSSGRLRSFTSPVANLPDAFGIAATLTGSGINATNNATFIGYDGSFLAELFRTGNVLAGHGRVRSFQPPRQASASGSPRYASVLTLTSALLLPISSSNDTGIRIVTATGAETTFIREGTPSPFGPNYGQIGPWVSFEERFAVFPAALIGSPSGAGLVKLNADGIPVTSAALVSKDAVALAGALFNTFPSAQANGFDSGEISFRATLKRQPLVASDVTASNNEGLWKNFVSINTLLLRKGFTPPGLPADFPRVKRILKHWTLTSNGTTRALVQLSGPTVTSSNDLALLEINNPGTATSVLLREGDFAPGCASARIATLLRVDANSSSGYAVLLSLVPSPGVATSSDNLALYARSTAGGSLYQPTLMIRKGTRFHRNSSTFATLSSIAFSKNVTDPTGAAASGLPHAICPKAATPTVPVTVSVIASWTDRTQSVLAITTP